MRRVRFQVAAPELDLSGTFLKMFPTVTTFEFAADPISYSVVPLDTSRWTWENPHVYAVSSLDHLETLKLSQVTITDVDLPQLPALKRLEIRHSSWEGYGIFLLLRLARRTLETISIDQVSFPPVYKPADDWLEHVHVRHPSLLDPGDVAPSAASTWQDAVPILLPALRQLDVVGPSPPLFASLDTSDSSYSYDDDYYPTPALRMPNLDRCFIDNVDVETWEDEALAPLAVLGRNAPLVTHLTLQGLITSDWQVHCCLASMAAKVTSLDLYQSSVTDWLIARLPALVPSLKTLDVRLCDEVSPQGVARMVERIRDLNDEGQSKVEQVFVDPPTRDGPTTAAYDWLDFVGVLQRDEGDYEGAGPVDDVDARRKWVKEGKKDEQWEHKALLAQLEAAEQERRELEARARASRPNPFGISSGSSSSGSRGGGGALVGSSAIGPSVSFAPPRSAPTPHPHSTWVPFNPFHQNAPAPSPFPASIPMRHQQQQQPLPPRPPTDLSSLHLPPLLPYQQHQPWSPAQAASAHEQPHTYSPAPRPSASAPPAALAPRVAPHPLAPAQQHAAVTNAIAADRSTGTSSTEDADELEVDYSFLDEADGGASHIHVDFLRAQEDALARMGAARADSVQAQVQAQVDAVAAAIGRGEAGVASAQDKQAAEEREQGRMDEAQAAATLVFAHQQAFAAARPAEAPAPPPSQNGAAPVFQGFAGDDEDSTDDGDGDDDMVPLGEADEDERDEAFEPLV